MNQPKSVRRLLLNRCGMIVIALALSAASAQAAIYTWVIDPGEVGAGNGTITGGSGTWNRGAGANGNWTIDGGANNIA